MKESESRVLTKGEAVELLSNTARASLSKLVKAKQYIAGFDDEGSPVYQTAMLFDPTQLDVEGVAEISVSKAGLKVKMRDRTAAIAQLSKMNGWDAPLKTEYVSPACRKVFSDDELKAAVVKILGDRGLPTNVYGG